MVALDLTTLQAQRQLKLYAATLIRQMVEDPFRGTALLLAVTAISAEMIEAPPPEQFSYQRVREVLLKAAEKLDEARN